MAKGLGIQSDPSRMLFLSATRGEIQISQSLLIVGGARFRHRFRDGAGAFGKYPCVGSAPLALHGSVIVVQSFTVLRISFI
jgi:hypothetical protein